MGYPTNDVVEGLKWKPLFGNMMRNWIQKKRLTLREAGYEYYHVSVLPDQRIVLEPRVLTAPFEVSANTLKMMDSAVENMKMGKVSPALELSEFEE